MLLKITKQKKKTKSRSTTKIMRKKTKYQNLIKIYDDIKNK